MDKNDVSILLEILDLEYLKPILIDRFKNLNDLSSVNLNDIGIQNPDDISKLRYALDELEQNENSIEKYDPILSMNDTNHMITRIENETNLVSSSLNLLLDNNTNRTLPRDDATSDIDYSLYNCDIDKIEADVEQIETNVNELIQRLEKQFPQLQLLNQQKKPSKKFFKETFVILTLSVLCIGFMFYMKRK